MQEELCDCMVFHNFMLVNLNATKDLDDDLHPEMKMLRRVIK